jgi:hypothetical protein
MNFSTDAMLSGSYPVRSFTPTIYYRLNGTLGKRKVNVGGVELLGQMLSFEDFIPLLEKDYKPLEVEVELPELTLSKHFKLSNDTAEDEGFKYSITPNLIDCTKSRFWEDHRSDWEQTLKTFA